MWESWGCLRLGYAKWYWTFKGSWHYKLTITGIPIWSMTLFMNITDDILNYSFNFIWQSFVLKQLCQVPTKCFLGYFHLVGVIFTPWGKIYPFKGKMKSGPFCTVIFGEETATQCGFCRIVKLFSSWAAINPQKLETRWLIGLGINCPRI